MARLYFKGRANIWFRYYQASRGFVPWHVFVNDVLLRFENPENRDVQDLFNKLRQTWAVFEYEDQFEELRALVMAKNKGFNEKYFVSNFVSGFKDHIKGAIKHLGHKRYVMSLFWLNKKKLRWLNYLVTTPLDLWPSLILLQSRNMALPPPLDTSHLVTSNRTSSSRP